MPKTVKVELSAAVEGHGELLKELSFREPRWDEIAEHGEPFQMQYDSDGKGFHMVNMQALRAYAEACIEPNTASTRLVLKQLGVNDTRRVMNGVGSFFQSGLVEDTGSTS